MNISTWAIRNPVPVVLLFALLTLLGVLGYRALPVQNMPDMDLPLIYVTTSLEGASPAQLETEVARKIEDKIATLNRLAHIQTTITDGLVNITAIFEIDKNPEAALNEVRNAVESARNDLPPDATPPGVTKSTTQPGILATYAIRSDRLDETELSWFVDHDLAKTLLAVPGVGEITRIGGLDREIHIDLDPAALAALGLTAADLTATLRSVQADHPAGRAEISAGRQTLRALGALRDPAALAALRIPVPGRAAPVRLDDIARITDTHADRASLATLDGRPVIALQIKRANGFSDLATLDAIRAALAAHCEKTPGLTLTEAANTAGPAVENHDASLRMLWEGALIAILVVLVFLKDWRATLIAATALPLSILPAFIAMRALGLGLNALSLTALSLVTGILVDDAIVEIENIARHARPGRDPVETAGEAAREIGLAVLATTLTLVAVFLPTAFMGGIFGLVFREFGLTAAAAILASLLVARLLTPMMAAKWMRPAPAAAATAGAAAGTKVGQASRLPLAAAAAATAAATTTAAGAAAAAPEKDAPLMRAYLALVRKTLARRKTTLALLAAFLAASLALALLPGAALFDQQDNSQTTVLLTHPPGTPLAQTEKTAAEAAALIRRIPDVKTIFAAIGAATTGEDYDTTSVADRATATLTVTLPPLAARKRRQPEIENDIRAALAALPGVRVEVGAGADGTRLDLTLAGDDPRLLETTAARLETQLRALPGLGAIISSAALETREIQLIPDPAQTAALGLTTEALAAAARAATHGDYAARLPRLNLPERQLPIRVTLPPATRENLDALALLPIPAPAAPGATLALGDLARLEAGASPAAITRLDRARNITLSIELNGRNLGETAAEALRLPVLQNLPEGITLVPQGELEDMAELFTRFGQAMFIGLFCIYAVLVLLFRDFLQPLAILAAIPLALGGALLPLVLAGGSFSMSTIIGFLMLTGIVTKNSILLVEYIIMARGKGMPRPAAIADACRKRARPILMTTLAMTGGMAPVLLGLAGGDPGFRQPMALVVVGGLTTSTLLSLVVIPVVYTLLDDAARLLTPAPRRAPL